MARKPDSPTSKSRPAKLKAARTRANKPAGQATSSPKTLSPLPPLTADDLEVADRVAGRDYSAANRVLMLKRVSEIRDHVRLLHDQDLSGIEPVTHFDPLLPGTPLPTGQSRVRIRRGRTPGVPRNRDDLAFFTVVELSRLIKSRRISSRELTALYLDRLKRYGPPLHCVVTLTEELAMSQAARADEELARGEYRGPLHGIPWGAKDLLSVRGIRTTWGARPYADQVFDFDATVVQRLEAAGAVLAAKLSMGELAMGDRWFGGLTRTPWNPEEGASGSSAGSGSATAAGLVGFAIGTETHGSIISPCVRNGVTGLRPTYGRVSRYGAMALSWTLDKIGPMARGVEDCALVFGAIYGPDGRDGSVRNAPFRWNPAAGLQGLRVGMDAAAFAEVEKEEARGPVYTAVLEALRGLGVDLRPVRLPERTPLHDTLWTILEVEAAASFSQLIRSGRLDLLEGQGEENWPNILRAGSTIAAADYLQALQLRRRLQEEMALALRDIDAYVTIPFVGPNLFFTNMAGHPSVVTRCGMLEGKPQSVEFIGGLYREDAALRVAYAYEQATPWHTQWPDMTGMGDAS